MNYRTAKNAKDAKEEKVWVEREVNINGCVISYVRVGVNCTSAPILFLHGWGIGLEPYFEAIDSLSQDYCVIAPHLPGFGKSSDISSDWDYHKYARYLVKFLEALDIRQVHVIGHSLGGGIAATLAALAPTYVASVILVGSTGVPVEEVPVALVKKACELILELPQVKNPQLTQAGFALLHNLVFRGASAVHTLFLSIRGDIQPLLPKIEAPTLLLWSINDLTEPIDVAYKFLHQIKNAQLQTLEHVYHEWNIFYVKKFTLLVCDFLEKVSMAEIKTMIS